MAEPAQPKNNNMAKPQRTIYEYTARDLAMIIATSVLCGAYCGMETSKAIRDYKPSRTNYELTTNDTNSNPIAQPSGLETK